MSDLEAYRSVVEGLKDQAHECKVRPRDIMIHVVMVCFCKVWLLKALLGLSELFLIIIS